MRLWHIKLLSGLNKDHLVAQWRELSAIAGAIQKNGTPNHLLVNFVLDYDFNNFISYAYYLRKEMTKRNIRTMESVWNKIISLKKDYIILEEKDVYNEKMNDEYLIICYYNLYEKFLCGMYSKEEFLKIKNIVKTYIKTIDFL